MQLDSMLAFTVLNSSLHVLVELYGEKYRKQDFEQSFPDDPEDFGLPVKETFDFIIAGGGTAGSILANRLSKRFSVLLLEAGGTPVPIETVPRLCIPLFMFHPVHYIYYSVPQKTTNLDRGGIVRTSSGKFLGGSSSHNCGQYERGSPFGYDHWATVASDDSWKYENMLKYFIKMENYHGQFPENGQHGKGGPVRVTSNNVTFRDDIFFSAGKELGMDVGLDSNGPQRPGFSPVEYNRDEEGRRVSSYSAYLKPIEKTRKNLTIRRYSVVSEIIFNGTVAVGVRYERHGVPMAAFASKEVIVSAGAYVTPIILIKSGVGPQDQLDAAKITPVSVLPVGQHFQDHVAMSTPSIMVTDKSVFKKEPLGFTFDDVTNYVRSGEGLIGEWGIHEVYVASSRAETQDGNAGWPDIQIYLGQNPDNTGFFCKPGINRPNSRGTVSLNVSAQTLAESLNPVIDYNFFSDETDYQVALEAIEMCYKIARNTTTFAGIGATMSDELTPECKEHLPAHTLEYIKCAMGYISDSNYHMVGTAPMGVAGDKMSVVDSKLRVHGVTNLRVCDASVMPTISNGNTAAPIMVIAEKLSDEIIQAWS